MLPAEGERRAATGYQPQYQVSASLIVKALRRGTLEWIRIADPQAGRVDDFQLGSTGRVDAYQFKWSLYPEYFTFGNLANGSPSLIFQLAEGYKTLCKRDVGKRIVVHLITNNFPSKNDSLPASDSPPTDQHFAAFLEQAWKPAKAVLQGSGLTVPTEWQAAWERLQQASGLSAAEFPEFVRNCELDFAYALPEADLDFEPYSQRLSLGDVNQVASFLFKTVASPQRVIELDAHQLLTQLGWSRRFEYANKHVFPVATVTYTPIYSTIQDIDNALRHFNGGYIAVTGSPGSGKSTLLTETFRSRRERVLHYYAYVPDAQDPGVLRGEAENFLHDVVLGLHRLGFSGGEAVGQFDRQVLLPALHRQLQLLHDDFRSNGQKTIIVVDGLDHIEREQHPQRTFLADLPTTVPDGVYFVLGSQTVQLGSLPAAVRTTLAQAERHIEIQPLTRAEVLNTLRRLNFPFALSSEIQEKIYALSDGHPLALTYILNRLDEVSDLETVHSILNETPTYTGDIEQLYEIHWTQVEDDGEIVTLLGLLSRLRRVIDMAWVEQWADSQVLRRLVRTFKHYFRVDNNTQWYFFHNSFRLFLNAKTAQSAMGVLDEARNRRYHQIVADYCREAPRDSPWAWEELYHRYHSGEHATILQLATQQWFRDQFFAFRAPDAIQADTRLALRSAAELMDPVAVARLILVSAEHAQREQHLESAGVPLLLCDLGEVQKAAEYARDGNLMRLKPVDALELCARMLFSGFSAEAARLFDLAEPMDLLTSPLSSRDASDRYNLLTTWVEVAVHFRPIEQVISMVRQVRRETEPARTPKDQGELTSRQMQSNLLLSAGNELITTGRWLDLASLMSALDDTDPADLRTWFWLKVKTARTKHDLGEGLSASSILEEALQHAPRLKFSGTARTLVAEHIYRITNNHDLTRSWLKGVRQPVVGSGTFGLQSGFDPFEQTFRLNRLLFVLGNDKPCTEIFPLPTEEHHQGLAYFHRVVCELARLYAAAWRGERLAAPLFVHQASALMRFFNVPDRFRKQTFGFAVLQARSMFYQILVAAATEHGQEAVDALREQFGQEWADATEETWPSHVKRDVITAMQTAGAPADWVRANLRAVQPHIYSDYGVIECVEDCREQAKADLTADDVEAAREAILRMLDVSFGVGYRKDSQVDRWIEWLGLINDMEPESAAARIEWFARAIVPLHETTEDAPRDAAEGLLSVTFRWSARRSVNLLRWLNKHSMLWHEAALRILVTEALQSDESSAAMATYLLADFLLPFSKQGDSDLAYLLIERTANAAGQEAALNTARYLISHVDTVALPSVRHEWKRGISKMLTQLGVDAASLGITETDLQPLSKETENTSYRDLQLRDGTRLSPQDVSAQVVSAGELKALMEQEGEHSYFDWSRVISRLVPTLSAGEIYSLIPVVERNQRAALILSEFSGRLLALADRTGAWNVAEKALHAGVPAGWIRWHDGGSRLAALRALTQVDPERGRRMAFQVLARDSASQGWYPYQVVLSLHDILATLVDTVPVAQIWPEIEQYLHLLLGGYEIPAEGPPGWAEEPADDTPQRALADMLVSHLNHPVTIVAWAAQRACVRLLLRSDPDISSALSTALAGDESERYYTLYVIDGATLQGAKLADPLCNQLKELTTSPNWIIRFLVQRILDRLGLSTENAEPVPVPVSAQELPAIYSIALKGKGTSYASPLGINAHEALPDTRNPSELVSPYSAEVAFISELSGLASVNIAYRTVEIMSELAPAESWSNAGENTLREMLQGAGLGLTYRRPSFELVRLAMGRVIGELINAGRLEERSIEPLKSELQPGDPALLHLEPERRPQSIFPLGPKREHWGLVEDWVQRIEDSLQQMSGMEIPGLTVLAESSTLKNLDWGTPIEVRRSVVLHGTQLQNVSGAPGFFPTVRSFNMHDYASISLEGQPLVVRNQPNPHRVPGAEWLALQPEVGYRLGWKLSPEGLFRWEDKAGKTMAYSIWWVDGLLERQPPKFYDDVGEGWLVVVSEEALDQLKSAFGPLSRTIWIRRQRRRDHVPEDNELSVNLPLV